MNLKRILQEITEHLRPNTKLWVAYSGGMDSTVLLHALSQSELSSRVSAIHVNHQLSPLANEWSDHCVNMAQELGTVCTVKAVHVVSTGKGIESSAREERYAVFEKLMGQGDVILFAHHKNDAAETLVFRLMRGAGLRGLAGMRSKRPLGQGNLLRPLLGVTRAELLRYAQDHRLRWVEDESNKDTKYDRNFLRHEIFPLLNSRWQNVEDRIYRAAGWLEEADDLLAEFAEEDLVFCGRKKERFGESVGIEQYSALSTARQKHLLRSWCDDQGFTLPDAKQLAKVGEVVHAREDAQPKLEWGECALHRFQGRLFLIRRFRAELAQPTALLSLTLNGVIQLDDGSTLECVGGDGTFGSGLVFDVAFRSAQQRCQPVGRNHSRSLKKLLQEYRLEPWLRDRIPLVFLNGDLVAVGGLFYCPSKVKLPDDFAVKWHCNTRR